MFTFTHIPRKSTHTYGITVPKSAYPFLELPLKGDKRKIRLEFGNGEAIDAWLRHLNNTLGHVQIRYDGSIGDAFRNWLTKESHHIPAVEKPSEPVFLEITVCGDNRFRARAVSKPATNRLRFADIRVHKIKEPELFALEHFVEMTEALTEVYIDKNERQIYYNSEIDRQLCNRSWLRQQPVVSDPAVKLKCDFRKDQFQLEVEFGNARTYYQDIIKFAMSYNGGLMTIGGLLVPSTDFARYLCDLGRRRAIEKSEGRSRHYSGMMDFTKAVNEFDYIKEIFHMPFFIASIAHLKKETAK
jgi:hypothetical protein